MKYRQWHAEAIYRRYSEEFKAMSSVECRCPDTYRRSQQYWMCRAEGEIETVPHHQLIKWSWAHAGSDTQKQSQKHSHKTTDYTFERFLGLIHFIELCQNPFFAGNKYFVVKHCNVRRNCLSTLVSQDVLYDHDIRIEQKLAIDYSANLVITYII